MFRSLLHLTRRIAMVMVVLGVALLWSTGASAQPGKAAPIASAAATVAKDDEEAADSPRASMKNFLELADRGRFAEAAIYLDVPRGSEKRAPELASRLYVVLSQRLLVNPDQLSPLAQGKGGDGLPTGTEELGKINDAKGRPVAIRIVRHESKALDDEARWVFSQSTVAHVDALYGALRDRWMRDRLPPALLVEGPLALYYWQWLALPLLAAACLALGRGLSFVSGLLAKPLLARRSWSEPLLQRLKRPTTIGWALAAFAILLPYLALTLKAEDLLERVLRALGYVTFFWGLVRAVIVTGNEIAHAEWARTRPGARSLAAVGVSLGKVVVVALAFMVALSELGYPVTSVVAGLGIGGVALALAAQKTVENLFGSISILVDQPFQIGDTIRVDTIEGTVETIGLRSTRVRTVERTLVIFPNGKLADMRIESLGPRDRIRFATRLELARSTTAAQLKATCALAKTKLEGHEKVRKEEISVRLSGLGDDSYDVDVSAPVETTDINEFARIKEELLLACLEAVDKSGARLAVPTRQLLEPSAASPENGLARAPS